MLGLPKTTEFNKRIPKQKFYENLTVTPALKKVFIDQIKTIYWRNKIAASTTNLAPGTAVTELEVFEVKLNSQILDDSFCAESTKIPHHILFIGIRRQVQSRYSYGKNPAATQLRSAFTVPRMDGRDAFTETGRTVSGQRV